MMFEIGESSLSTAAQPPIGVLTAGHRDNWYNAYTHLNEISETNQENFKAIEDGLFMLCLDDYSAPKNLDMSHLQMFHNHDAHNRWFDKCVQLIVSSNGRAGVNGEHSPVDAVVPGRMFEFVLSQEPASDPENSINGKKLKSPERLIWKVDEQVTKHIQEASSTALALIKDTESCLLQTDLYGSRYIKEVAKVSPDAYIQIALQLAYQRVHRAITPVYESSSTRLFKHGRTETGRSMSMESMKFVKAFDNDDILVDVANPV